MPGTNSSARDAATAPEALSFTVHSMPAPDLSKRRIGGRLRMLLVFAACAAPVIASYLTYYVVRPERRSNYGDLIVPTRPVPNDLALRTLDGAPVDEAKLEGQWLLVIVGDANCNAACEKRVYLQRQLREMLGKERDRVDRVWLVTDDATPAPALMQAAQATGELSIWHADRAAVERWLASAAGQPVDAHLYVVDPRGQLMMRAPTDPEPTKLKGDLDRLLRASASWDRAGH